MRGPSRVALRQHASDRCREFGHSVEAVSDLVLANHQRRRRNPGSADWLVLAGGLTVAYNWPDQGDTSTARIVTLWPQR